MKVLITNTHLSIPHGSEIWTAAVAQELVRRGHDVYLYTSDMGDFHYQMLRNIPTISGPGGWQKDENDNPEPFDFAILQHLNQIKNDKVFGEAIFDLLPPSKRIILICHGTGPSAEQPVPREGVLEDAHYVCISEEIKNHYPEFPWEIVKQPIDPAWFMPPKTLLGKPERVVWAAHRFTLSDSFTDYCVKNQIGVFATGNKLQYPHEIRDTYSKMDLVIGTGRWAYEALAAGIPCIIANRNLDLGYVTLGNVQEFEKYNMTPRHPSAHESNWEQLFENYHTDQVEGLRKYAENSYHVSVIVDQFMKILGIESVGDITNQVYS